MAIIQLKSKVERLTPYGKKKVAHALFYRGVNFMLAAKILEKKGGYRYVVLHLLCQGLEIIIKGLLLMQNYDKYKPKLTNESRGGLGHNLVRGSEELRNELDSTSLKIDEDTMSELKILNNFYHNHLLRYGSPALDLFVEPKTISSDLVIRYAFKLVRFGNRKFRIKKPTNR